MKTSITVAWVLVSFGASAAFAAPKISVQPFTGPKAAVPRGQLVKVLCASYDCVPPAKVSRKGRPDWKKLKAQDVDLVLTGAVTGPAAKRNLRIEAYDGRGHPLWRETKALSRNGTLTRTDAERLTAKVDAHLAPPPTQPKTTAPPPSTTRRPVAEEPKPKPESVPSPQATGPKVRGRTAVESQPQETREHEVRAPPPTVVAAVGAASVYRNFEYVGLQHVNLRAYETRPAFFAPEFHLELYPLARILSGVAQGVGVEADYLFAVGLRTVDENGVLHSTTANRLDVAARLNFRPSERLMIAPVVGYRAARFEVGAATNGARLQGLPNVSWEGMTLGAEVEYAPSSVVVFGRAQFLPLFGVGEIGSDAFFPDHSGWGMDARIGVGYRFVKHFELRATLDYARYSVSLTPTVGATFLANSALDQYVTGALLARAAF